VLLSDSGVGENGALWTCPTPAPPGECLDEDDFPPIRPISDDYPGNFYSAAALLEMQSAVLATEIPSVRLSVRPSHAGTIFRRMNIGSRGLHCEVAKTLVF